jgi:hypothetical protein
MAMSIQLMIKGDIDKDIWRYNNMEDVKDVLHDIEKWAEAYELLKEFSHQKCSGNFECGQCGFNSYCNKAMLLMDK